MFKIGEVVTCVDNKKLNYLTIGKEYKIIDVDKHSTIRADDGIRTPTNWAKFVKMEGLTQYEKLKIKRKYAKVQS